MLNKHPHTELPAWRVVDIYARSDVKTCWVLQVGDARFVPGTCDECENSDTLVDLYTRREDDGDCARCGAKGASIYYDGCRDSLTLVRFVAMALFGDAPDEAMECACCKRVLGYDYFPRVEGQTSGDVCAWCLTNPTPKIGTCVQCIMPTGGNASRQFALGTQRCTECVADEKAATLVAE